MAADELRAALRPLTERQVDAWNDPLVRHARRCRVSTNQQTCAVTIQECQCGVAALIAFVRGEEPADDT